MTDDEFILDSMIQVGTILSWSKDTYFSSLSAVYAIEIIAMEAALNDC